MRLLSLVLVIAFVGPVHGKPNPVATCLDRSGSAASACLTTAPATGDPDAAPIPDAVGEHCPEVTANALGYLDPDDIVRVLTEGCGDFVDDFRTLTTPTTAPAAGSPDAKCLSRAIKALSTLRAKTIVLFGKKCFVRQAQGKKCKRPQRDKAFAGLQGRATKQIQKQCPSMPAGLLAPDALVETVANNTRHFAQRVFPPNDLGPSAELGPYPVGVTTLDLVDPSRPDTANPTDPRKVTVEVWYPSTPEAVAGVPRYVVNLFGFDIAKTFTYRDVAHAPGPFPLVLFSHGNSGIRFQSVSLMTLLASHGYVVASPDHRGNTFLDPGGDPDVATNRPIDMTFVLDQMLARNAAPGDPFAGTIDPTKVGMSGHSFGGFTTFALATGPQADTRIGAFLPLAPASPFDAAFLSSIDAPILIMGGSLDTTTPFDTQQQAPFDLLPSGAPIVGLANIIDAGHFTFSDICEVPRNLVGAIGGFDDACTPEFMAWRAAHDLINYLAHNFFDAVLRGDAEALARLDPATLASFDDLDYQSK